MTGTKANGYVFESNNKAMRKTLGLSRRVRNGDDGDVCVVRNVPANGLCGWIRSDEGHVPVQCRLKLSIFYVRPDTIPPIARFALLNNCKYVLKFFFFWSRPQPTSIVQAVRLRHHGITLWFEATPVYSSECTCQHYLPIYLGCLCSPIA